MVPSRKKIICINSSTDDSSLFRYALTEFGYEVEIAQSLTDGLQAIAQVKFDLCITTVSPSEEIGFELLEKIYRVDSKIPIIACSTDTRISTWHKTIQAGAWVFFPKPIDFNSLHKTIERLLKKSHSVKNTSAYVYKTE